MTTISKGNNFITLINIFTVEPVNQQKLIDLLTLATNESVRQIPGFISSSLHRSLDGHKVNSLQTRDFNRSYKKKMYSDIFKADQLNSNGDSTGGRLMYSNMALDINQFIKDSSSVNLDQEAYSSLFFVESKYLPTSEISKQLSDLKIKYPNDSAFVDMLTTQYVTPVK